MVQAVKARDSARLGVIRFIRSEAKNREIELGRRLDDEDVVDVLSRIAKKHREAIEQFERGGRPDLVEKEQAQLSIIGEYLPASLGAAELDALVTEAIAEVGASGPKDIGQVMKTLMPKVRGRADGRAINDLVRSKLAELAGA
jgi:uncharacterized protein YqeY